MHQMVATIDFELRPIVNVFGSQFFEAAITIMEGFVFFFIRSSQSPKHPWRSHGMQLFSSKARHFHVLMRKTRRKSNMSKRTGRCIIPPKF
jgi:hypothetical protein